MGADGVGGAAPYLVLEVRRDHIVADTLQQVAAKLDVCMPITATHADCIQHLKKPLKVKYVGEQGIDLGGLGTALIPHSPPRQACRRSSSSC